MNMEGIEEIPVDRILVVNPRTRNRVKWLEIVASIKAVGLKRPITVCPKEQPDDEGHMYDLVCGQGRLEVLIELGQSTIKAVRVKASEADRDLLSLVENIARRPSSYKAIYFEVRNFLERGYGGPVIAQKLGIDRSYIHGIVRHARAARTQSAIGGLMPTLPKAFQQYLISIPLTEIAPQAVVTKKMRSSAAYRQIEASVKEIGLIEPLAVFSRPVQSYLLLDGHLRYEVLKEMAQRRRDA